MEKPAPARGRLTPRRTVQTVIEVPKWGFVKRGSRNRVDFVSPLPCPYNYGCVPDRIGLDGDLLDVLVVGGRLPRGTRVRVQVYGAIGMSERGHYDDKLIGSATPLSRREAQRVLWFFRLYAFCKGILNVLRNARGGFARCEGWGDTEAAFARSTPRDDRWRGPTIPF
jgi:inorganic pyrophosphatase